ncbi:MAG: VanZ like family protein [Herminiimonas sp.]|nr:VanZ like family protein [Herminiimonas sp.]
MNALYDFAASLPRALYLTVAIVLYLLMLYMGTLEPAVDALPGRENWSKVYHVVFYSGFAGLLWFGMMRASVPSIATLIAFAGAIDEINQSFQPFREARVTDVLIDIAAGLTAAILLHALRRRAKS